MSRPSSSHSSSSHRPPSPLSLPQSNYSPPPRPRTPLKRRRSLHLLAHPPPIPIPPSLLQSPYLSPQSDNIKRQLSVPRLPSREDELWLQDTVPLASQTAHTSLERAQNRSPGPSPLQWHTSRSDKASGDYISTPCHPEHPRGRDPNPRNYGVAQSPHPLLHHRVLPLVYPTRPQWLTHGQARSEPDISRLADHTYLPTLASLRR
ncbi:hypothetical protein BDQ17DRAFT_1347926 [Cyathus striatus]|nr:hypothetical protein BDQ17DRAFT_1347926 [Cyathus striatus]